jgi:hypothetical protein
MRTQSLGQAIFLAVLLTGAWGVVMVVTQDDTEPLQLALTLPLLFIIILGTMRVSNRLMTRLFPERQPPPPPPATPPSTERPDHARRRRRRRGRRPRG